MIKNIVKGFIIGVGKIIPGVSGSMLAILMGVYEKALEIISNLKEMRWKDFLFIMSLALGVFIGISLLSQSISWLLKKRYLWTMLLFIGLISSGIKDVYCNVFNDRSLKNVKFKYVLVMLLSGGLSFLITLLGNGELAGIVNVDNPNNSFFSYYLIGILEAFSSIIPGISGTAIFMSLGYYQILLSIYENILNPAQFIWTSMYFLGVITGILVLAKVINFLLKKHSNFTYAIILGFLLASILSMFVMTLSNIVLELRHIPLGTLVLIVGYFLGKKINTLLSKE